MVLINNAVRARLYIYKYISVISPDSTALHVMRLTTRLAVDRV